MYSQHFNQHCPDWATALLNGFSQIFLQRHPLCGLLCLLAILFSAPSLLGGALLGGVAGLLTAQRRGYAKAERQAGLYSYNGVLLGLLLSQQLAWSVLLWPLIIAAGGLSAIFTQQWFKRARDPASLPTYTTPFVALAWLLLSLAEVQPASSASTLAISGPNLLAALFQGLGQIMLLERPLAGGLIAIGLFLASRRAAFWALCGSAAGLAFGVLYHDAQGALLGLTGYNPALAALALSQISRRPWWPLSGITLAILLAPGFASLGLPALTAPFILACWLARASARLFCPVKDKPATVAGLRIDR